ncbi:MAG TPA: TadE/TadG family type IV pilus assembly protein [Candidatus Baltobacteraceae bacterium]|jgi:Flp pilus assembly protein TadG
MNASRQAGNAIVEFALVLPFLLLITLGIIALGRYTYFGIVVANAARAGALYGAQPGGGAAEDSAGMILAAENDMSNNGVGSVASSPAPTATKYCMYWVATTPNPSPNPTANPTCAQTSYPNIAVQYVTVTLTGKASSGLPRVPFLPSTITVTRTAVQRVQQ